MLNDMQSVTRRGLLMAAGALGMAQAMDGVSAQEEPFGLSLLVEGLDSPLFMVDANDGSDRFLIVEQTGRIRIFQEGALLDTPWLDLSDQVSGGAEQGLLGLALHPKFAENGILFVDFTDLDGNTQVIRYTQRTDDPNQVDTSSAFTVLTVEQPAPNHNGGMLAFGPDGYLYVSLGDGGSQGDPDNNGQDLGTLLGKILRLDVDSDPGEDAYVIPPDNPFTDVVDARGEIWSYGLRNPWRFSFDRETGDLWIADVGQNAFEEVNWQPAGEGGQNYGWSRAEGFSCYNDPDCEEATDITWPVFTYGRDVGISISGGYVYRGTEVPALEGKYLCGDYGTGFIWILTPEDNGSVSASEPIPTDLTISSFAEDASGEHYVINLNGSVHRIVAA